jgi:hypothetical protein
MTAVDAASDSELIRNLISELALLADNCPAEKLLTDYIRHFAADAVWEMSNPAAGVSDRRIGHAEILGGVRERREAGRQGPGSNVRHLITTVGITVEGDQATGETYALLLGDTNSKPTVRGVGHYTDKFRRVDGTWIVTSRTIVFE